MGDAARVKEVVVIAAPLIAKYLRLRREWLGADPVSGLHHRLALVRSFAQFERDFVDMGVTPFFDTQPVEHVENQDLSPRTA